MAEAGLSWVVQLCRNRGVGQALHRSGLRNEQQELDGVMLLRAGDLYGSFTQLLLHLPDEA